MNAHELIEEFSWNVRDLPIGVITISTIDGPQEADALLLGEWALNQNSQGWTVTHQRTGYAGKAYPTPIEALIELGIILGAGLKIPDDLTRESFGDGFRTIPGIAGIAARIKAGLAILESWDLDIDYNEPELDP